MAIEPGFTGLWSPEQISEWKSRRGPLDLAERLDSLGWSGEEAFEAFAARRIIRDTSTPDAPASFWRQRGKSLADALQDHFPPVPGNSMLNMRRDWNDGSLELISVWSTGVRCGITNTTRPPDGEWWQLESEVREGTLGEILAGNHELLTCSPLFAVQYELDSSTMPLDEFANQLRPAPDEPEVDWTANPSVAEHWERLHSRLELLDHPSVLRWATVNRDSIIWVLVDGKRFPLLWSHGYEPVGGQVIATHSWSSKSRFVPDVRNSLTQLDARVYAEQQWGDHREINFLVVGESSVPLPEILGDWVVRVGAQVEAAFALQPRPLKSDSWDGAEDAWDRFSLLRSEVTFEVDEGLKAEIRQYLREVDVAFRETCDALAKPDSEEGKALRIAIEADVEDGEFGRLSEWYFSV